MTTIRQLLKTKGSNIWTITPDATVFDALKTMEEKERFLNEILSNDYYVFFQHDTQHECGTVKMGKRGYQIDKNLDLKSFIQS